MRIYYKVVFHKGNVSLTKRFEAEELCKANEFCNKVNGIICSCKEKIHIAWNF